MFLDVQQVDIGCVKIVIFQTVSFYDLSIQYLDVRPRSCIL